MNDDPYAAGTAKRERVEMERRRRHEDEGEDEARADCTDENQRIP